jgi:nuclear pore complex protein Nup205
MIYQDVPMLLAYHNTYLALLLRLANTRGGAAYVFNARLFQSVRDSVLFSIDPDIGLGKSHYRVYSYLFLIFAEFESPEALKRFFDLMLAVLRVINAVVLSKGPQSEQVSRQAREFLSDVRSSVVGIFKRHAKIGLGRAEDGEDLTDLVDNFTILISAVDFLEVRSSQL